MTHNLNICIWWQISEGASGGGNSFMQVLGNELQTRGITIENRPSSANDIVMVSAWNRAPGRFNSPGRVKEVMRRKRASILGRVLPEMVWGRPALKKSKRAKFVHRVDGVAAVYRDEGGRADREQFGINPLCDYTIFQSEYSRECFAEYGVTPENWTVVFNGVDTKTFHPANRNDTPSTLKIASSSWSTNHRKGFADLVRISEAPNVELHFYGNWPDDIDSRNVINHGLANRSELAEAYQGMDAFAHASLFESCSNSLLEGLASGLPTLYVDSGSNKQIAGNYGVELSENPTDSVERLRDNYQELRTNLVGNTEKFSISHAADNYEKVFRNLVDA
jgi:glycosyltransferase involved in cell wall biosynthesis